ncbi:MULTISPECIES: AbrB/MazE/SpoVT family DNA-binding domain-containing protein [unclassified Devosia]|jgi:antitoxin MazE|uniref:AbrB/MazE/SpoVT family DNA-binding domain-containing protein n=1 Tax=unclassified Devosia TaxID=196773 RepID=UPI000869B987|nr:MULTISPECIES: AbrB/MazE/SpoVT family DNA-binding domain-containing protein [unclassified Devosia]MBN9362051.1 AbrB/MazE/SpoVT family DNA-binding domain-containing protein [Devosia sp.]ODS85609.1 MAG: AbrB family transcriptional regulator [Devosia sp. SCN 66-27]OJX24677.1 MAG: AbrB family transcriptional regulator [Devosia sp. 66-14]
MKVSKWGNSLAIRIPTDVASRLGLKEGDEVDLQPSDTNGIELLRLASRRERIDRLRELLKGRLPADYRFDREAANARR